MKIDTVSARRILRSREDTEGESHVFPTGLLVPCRVSWMERSRCVVEGMPFCSLCRAVDRLKKIQTMHMIEKKTRHICATAWKCEMLMRLPCAHKLSINLPACSAPESALASSVFLETVSTICLHKTLANRLWFIPAYTGYALSFYLFPQALEKFSLNHAYTIWSGVGMVITALYEIAVLHHILNTRKMIGMLLVAAGIFFVS